VSRKRRNRVSIDRSRARIWPVIVVMLAGVGVLEGRLLYLQLVDHDFLTAQGDNRHIRTVEMSAHRGPIVDRRGEVLAISTPVDSIWANPQEFRPALDRVGELAGALQLDPEALARRITSSIDREFLYLSRHLSPSEAAEVLKLELPGIYTQREYRRYYPAGEVTGQVLGFTDIDDIGQEGLELAYDYWMRGEPGSKRVRRDRLGRLVDDVDLVHAPRDGRVLTTSLDLRLQYLAYRELKRAVTDNAARSGCAVVLDPNTGEVLAMVNQPTFNPNDRGQRSDAESYRNRVVTDLLEPGSAIKPFVIAAALERGEYGPDSIIDTSPGYVQVGSEVFEDPRNLGRITLTTLLARSSNVGAVRLAMTLEPERMWGTLSAFGIGRLTEIGFPGESAGKLNEPQYWRPVGQATQAFGYGLSVTTLQLARAYAAIAADGVLPAISLLAREQLGRGERAVSARTAEMLRDMLQVVVSPHGSGLRAAVENYTIAGKTGTARKADIGGYDPDRHTSVFAGLAPANDSRFVIVVVVDEPGGDAYYGGDVAAPVFARIAAGALRTLAVPPDALAEPPLEVLARAEVRP
jgi:cell division protein FtsI (penicillin-binding protein 3)